MHGAVRAGLALVGALAAVAACAAESISGARLYGDVQRYAAFGTHRTGSAADLDTSEWLAQALEAAGVAVERHRFGLAAFEPAAAVLATGGGEIHGFPAWFPRPTPAAGVRAVLREMRAGTAPDGAIAFVDAGTAGTWHAVDVAEHARRAAAAGAAGLVLAIDHPSGEHYQPNAKPPHVQTSLPLPVLLVPASAAAAVRAALGQEVVLRVEGRLRTDAHGVNLVGRVQRNAGPWIVVSTPTSGWFGAAGERGPGVALWLALARRAAARDDGANYLFVAASGHELDYLGARSLLAQGALPPPATVKAWLHLGASIGVRDWQAGEGGLIPLERVQPDSYLFAAAAFRDTARRAFAALPDLAIHPVESLPERRGGELALYRDAGYPVLGFVGHHRFFHTPRDLPDVTSAALLAPYGEALQRLLAELAGGE